MLGLSSTCSSLHALVTSAAAGSQQADLQLEPADPECAAQCSPQLVGMCVMAISAGGLSWAVIMRSSAAVSSSPMPSSGMVSITMPLRLAICSAERAEAGSKARPAQEELKHACKKAMKFEPYSCWHVSTRSPALKGRPQKICAAQQGLSSPAECGMQA